MEETAEALREIVRKFVPELRELSDQEVASGPEPGKWSPKEILGHLVDSAVNNQMKFVRTMESGGQDLPGYHQDEWVTVQKYSQYSWHELIDLWAITNRHLAHIIEHANPVFLSNTLTIEGAGPFTLEFIMKDYPEHQKHHLKQIFPEADISSAFEMVY